MSDTTKLLIVRLEQTLATLLRHARSHDAITNGLMRFAQSSKIQFLLNEALEEVCE